MIPGGSAHGIRATIWRWWKQRDLRRREREAHLWRAIMSINTALGVYDPEPGCTTLADPLAHLRAARKNIHDYLEGKDR